MSKLIQKIEELEERADMHSELLYAVQRKFEGETRHETALRYIKQAESFTNNIPQKAEK